MRERNRLFKLYCSEINPTLKVVKHNKYENAWNLVIFKVKKLKKQFYQNYFQKHSKNVLNQLKSKDKTAPNLLISLHKK